MDIVATANHVVQSLWPVLPYLAAKTGDVATKGAIKKVGEETWARARALWEKLRPAVEENPAAAEAVGDLAAQPDDKDCQAALRVQLRKLFEADQTLAEEIAKLVEQQPRAGVNVSASGKGAVSVGRDNNGTIVTGNRVRVTRS